MNRELPDVQDGFRKGRGTRDQIANIHWIIEKAREFQKNIYFWFIDYAKAFDCVESESEVTQSCLTLCDPIDCSLPGSSIHWIFQARVLEWVAISFSRGSSWPRDRTPVFSIDWRIDNKLENSSRDENTRPPYLPPDKSVCLPRSNS